MTWIPRKSISARLRHRDQGEVFHVHQALRCLVDGQVLPNLMAQDYRSLFLYRVSGMIPLRIRYSVQSLSALLESHNTPFGPFLYRVSGKVPLRISFLVPFFIFHISSFHRA